MQKQSVVFLLAVRHANRCVVLAAQSRSILGACPSGRTRQTAANSFLTPKLVRKNSAVLLMAVRSPPGTSTPIVMRASRHLQRASHKCWHCQMGMCDAHDGSVSSTAWGLKLSGRRAGPDSGLEGNLTFRPQALLAQQSLCPQGFSTGSSFSKSSTKEAKRFRQQALSAQQTLCA